MIAIVVTSVLGEQRAAVANAEGEYSCPFCAAAARHPEPCGNPACDAGKWTTREHALERRAERERRAADDAEWERRAAVRRDYAERSRQAREAVLADWRRLAEEDGFCWTCLHRTDGRRKVRHRTPDYHAR